MPYVWHVYGVCQVGSYDSDAAAAVAYLATHPSSTGKVRSPHCVSVIFLTVTRLINVWGSSDAAPDYRSVSLCTASFSSYISILGDIRLWVGVP